MAEFPSLDALRHAMAAAGVRRLLVKELSANDNSKNQTYFGNDFSSLNLFPLQEIEERDDPRATNRALQAKLRFGWLGADGTVAEAPHAKLILYPQYPEVRFSGFLRGSHNAPAGLMVSREPGRLLFLGVTKDKRVVGHVVGSDSATAGAWRHSEHIIAAGVFFEIPLDETADDPDGTALLSELRRIHATGWIAAKRLTRIGLQSCAGPTCLGLTLEAELGIPQNASTKPDWRGWEVKAHSGARITLMTPEPAGGLYRERGVEFFMDLFGTVDRERPSRRTFASPHLCDARNSKTGLTLRVQGFDPVAHTFPPDGAIILVDGQGRCAAAWPYRQLLEHWNRKHSRAAYISATKDPGPSPSASARYLYGPSATLGFGTSFDLLLAAIVSGKVIYDPGISLDPERTRRPIHQRSQFRIATRSIGSIYERTRVVDLAS